MMRYFVSFYQHCLQQLILFYRNYIAKINSQKRLRYKYVFEQYGKQLQKKKSKYIFCWVNQLLQSSNREDIIIIVFYNYNKGKMYRLLDYNQTGRYLKIQNTFSVRKYPIYYSYDRESLDTYLTKIITNKDQNVINYFKAHINNNILPYLNRKREIKNASIISLMPEKAEVIIKINAHQKIEKCTLIKEKIVQYSTLLRTFYRFYKNELFRKQIKILFELFAHFEAKDDQLNEIIRQIVDQLNSLTIFLNYIDDMIIDNSRIIEQSKSFKSSQQQINSENYINKFIEFIQKLPEKGGKTKEISLKNEQIQQLKSQLSACSTMLSQRKSILKDFDYYKKQQYSSVIQNIYMKLQDQKNCLEQQQKTIYQSNFLYITKKHIEGTSLRKMIINKDERLTPDFSFDLTKTLVDLVFMYGGVNDLFITTENIIVEDCGTFHLNYFSFVGLEFVKFKKYVLKADFLQILPYINSYYLYQNSDGQIKMGIQVLLRFIIVNFVSAFLKKDIIFDAKSIDFQYEVSIDNLRSEMKLLQSKLLQKVISSDQWNRIIKDFDKIYKVNYRELAQAVFIPGRHNLSWEFIFSRLSKHKTGSSSQIYQDRSIQKNGNKVNILDIAKNMKKSINLAEDVFYVIGISLMELIDHFTNIISVMGDEQDKLSQLNPINYQKMNKLKDKLVTQRQYFQKKGWYVKQLYIPVKCGMTYTQILDYSNWVQMLYSQNRINLQTLKGFQNLLAFLLQLEQALVILQPLFNDEILETAMSKEKCTYYSQFYTQGKFKTYYTLIHNYFDRKIKILKNKRRNRNNTDVNMEDDEDRENNGTGMLNSDEESQEEEVNYQFKKIFWQCSFATLRIFYELIKNYYIRINEININSAVTILGGKYSKWIQEFNPKTPPLFDQT